MPEILSFGDYGRKKWNNPIPYYWRWFKELDFMVKTFVVFAILFVIATPSIVAYYFLFYTKANVEPIVLQGSGITRDASGQWKTTTLDGLSVRLYSPLIRQLTPTNTPSPTEAVTITPAKVQNTIESTTPSSSSTPNTIFLPASPPIATSSVLGENDSNREYTLGFKLSTSTPDVSQLQMQSYSEGIIVPISFADKSPGLKIVYVEFYGENGENMTTQAIILYVPQENTPPPSLAPSPTPLAFVTIQPTITQTTTVPLPTPTPNSTISDDITELLDEAVTQAPTPIPTPAGLLQYVPPVDNPINKTVSNFLQQFFASPTPAAPVPPMSTPPPIQISLTEDINHNGCININDFNNWLYAVTSHTAAPDTTPDINGDGVVNLLDFNKWYQKMASGQQICP